MSKIQRSFNFTNKSNQSLIKGFWHKTCIEKFWIAFIISLRIRYQNFWKKSGDIPLGLDALLGCIEKSASLISVSLTGYVSRGA